MANQADAKKALNVHEQHLASLQNVVGLGIVPESGAAKADPKRRAVAVYVEKKLPDNELPKGELIPKTLEIEVAGKKVKVKTKVIEQGRPEKEAMPQRESL